jgi:hypothetical protein
LSCPSQIDQSNRQAKSLDRGCAGEEIALAGDAQRSSGRGLGQLANRVAAFMPITSKNGDGIAM